MRAIQWAERHASRADVEVHQGNAMMAEDHSCHLRGKALELLSARGILEQVRRRITNPVDASKIYALMCSIQSAVFDLDSLGESVWGIESGIIEMHLNKIALAGKMLRNLKAFNEGLSEIKRYADIELGLRSGKDLVSIGLMEFYHRKCCDVRMHRAVLADIGWESERAEEEKMAWGLLDIVGEILDDVEDLDEDISTFNGNRFLESISAVGVSKSYSEYSDHVSDILRQIIFLRDGHHDAGFGLTDVQWILAKAAKTATHTQNLLRRICSSTQFGMTAKRSLVKADRTSQTFRVASALDRAQRDYDLTPSIPI